MITYPSGTQRLTGRGSYVISGLAWSGGGAIKRVEVSTDGGKTYQKAKIAGPPLPQGVHAILSAVDAGTGARRSCSRAAIDEKGLSGSRPKRSS